MNKEIKAKFLDKSIMSDGFIRIYSNQNKLDYDLSILIDKKYEIIEFDGNFISTKMELMFDLEYKLKFPDYFGKNYDALIDCLIDFEIPENGLILVFRHFNNLDLEHISILLDILCEYSRKSFVWDKRILTLIHVKEINFELLKPIGAVNFNLKTRMEK